jgi:hypothetical protein
MTLTVVEAVNGPANLKNVEDGLADVAFVASSLRMTDIWASYRSSRTV